MKNILDFLISSYYWTSNVKNQIYTKRINNGIVIDTYLSSNGRLNYMRIKIINKSNDIKTRRIIQN